MSLIVTSKDIQKELKKATKFYKDFHWGREVDKEYYALVPDPPSVVIDLGYLRAVIYETQKGDDEQPLFYIHAFERIFPILSTDTKGKHLFVSGGQFSVRKEGIVG